MSESGGSNFAKIAGGTMPTKPEPIGLRLWRRGRFNGECLEWVGKRNKDGYGVMHVTHNHDASVHRLMWKWLRGPIPDGLCVCHSCDNPACFNPDHLFLGTHIENMRDAALKGRIHFPHLRGEESSHHKLTAAQVLEIRKRSHEGATGRTLARDFNISFQQISSIVRGYSWRHLL